MKHRFLAYAAALLTLTVLDGIWLGYIARDFYQREIAEVAAPSFRVVPAVLFYLGYPALIAGLTLWPRPPTLAAAAGRAALLGLLAYGTYDLTNMATLKQWSALLAITDTAWGTVLTALMGAAAFAAIDRRRGRGLKQR